MNKSLFRYVWRYSKRDQLVIFAVVLFSLPFYYVSLDLPKKIVNEAIQGHAFENGQTTAKFLELSLEWPSWFGGGGKLPLFGGFEVGRLELLMGLSFVFLFFVLVNGLFKYWINVAKGALGERMMRRLRFQLFSYALRFTPEALRTVRSAEAATIIKDEVEPIGGFIGDAFIQPLLLGTQAATALLFILLQSVWLGLLAGAVVGVQFVVIPRMRRELLRLGRMRQIASRRFAGRVSEVIDGIEAVRVHDTAGWERAEIGGRLHELFDIRFKIYRRKFVVKFLNNLLAQMTPFFFYAVGGYFALSGTLNIGQLVAVIAAYRELPPPLKELIDWDQQRLDVQVKYDQVVAYFSSEKLEPADEEARDEAEDEGRWEGPLTIADVSVGDAHGTAVIAGGSFEVALPTRIAIVSDGTAAASTMARILAHRAEAFSGEVKIGDRNLSGVPPAVLSRHIVYANSDTTLFPGTLRDNLVYGLRQRQIGESEDDNEALRVSEAKRTGNPVETVEADWVDLERTGFPDPDALDQNVIGLLKGMGLEEDIYRFGLAGTIDPERQPVLAERIVEARERLRDKLGEDGMVDLVEPFDPERYNTQATVAENLLFGVPTARGLIGRAMIENEAVRTVLDAEKLTDDMLQMGISIAETMTEIFTGIPAGHPLFDQFSFLHADELGEFAEIVKRSKVKGRGGMTRDDRLRLLALPLAYIEPRHRLGLLTDELRARLLKARSAVHAMLGKEDDPGVVFYEPDKLNEAAPVRDNLLFGRVNETMANAREQVRAAGQAVINEMDLGHEIERVGLDHQVGPGGRLLSPSQRASVSLIRCLIKRPDILVLDGALAPFSEARVKDILDLLFEVTEGSTLAAVLPNERLLGHFDVAIRFRDKRAVLEDVAASDGAQRREPDRAEPADETPDPANDRDDEAVGEPDITEGREQPPRAAAE